MKKSLLLVICVCLLFFSCKKVVENIISNIDIPYETKEIVLPASLFIPPPGSTELKGYKDEIQERDSRIANFQEARLKSIKVQLVSPDNLNLGIIKEVNVYLLTDSTNGNLPRKLVAQKANVPAETGKELDLDVINDNVINYLEKQKYTVRTEVVLRQVITQDVTIKNKLVFNLKPKL
jgi:hypothetical protein